jgi:hypothetical protein
VDGRIESHDSKAGLIVKLTPKLQTQIDKDVALVREGFVTSVTWHFWQGADQSILDALDKAGIGQILHP